MRQVDVVRTILTVDPSAICVAALGTAVSAVRAATDDGNHLYMGGAMASALGGAIGIADAQPGRSFVAVVGDGELLMGAASLWTLGACRPSNLRVVVLADGLYGITGGQPLSYGRFVEVGRALDIPTARVTDHAELAMALRELEAPSLIEAVITESEWPGPSPFVDPHKVRLALAREFGHEIGVGT